MNSVDLQILLQRLRACPQAFFQAEDSVSLSALVADLIRDLRAQPLAEINLVWESEQSAAFDDAQAQNLRLLRLIACWLLRDEVFAQYPDLHVPMQALLEKGLLRFVDLFAAARVVDDAERCEEFARYCLQQLDLAPEGESVHEAADKLTALDSLEQQRIMQETQAAYERARHVREALEVLAREEAAAKVSRE